MTQRHVLNFGNLYMHGWTHNWFQVNTRGVFENSSNSLEYMGSRRRESGQHRGMKSFVEMDTPAVYLGRGL